MSKKILIADDHAIVREGIKQVLAEDKNLKVAGEAATIKELFTLLNMDKWDIVILDINMPDKSGLEALKEIKNQYPHLPVLILSMYGEEQYGIRALKAGASGYLKKVSAPEELVKAVDKILSGGKYVSPALGEKLAGILVAEQDHMPHEKLSDRELQILCMIASGKSADQIADELFLSVHTVYSYRNRILEKMKMKSNVEITQYAIRNNLITI